MASVYYSPPSLITQYRYISWCNKYRQACTIMAIRQYKGISGNVPVKLSMCSIKEYLECAWEVLPSSESSCGIKNTKMTRHTLSTWARLSDIHACWLYDVYWWCQYHSTVHERPSLIAGLECRLDQWTGLLDWITGSNQTASKSDDACVAHGTASKAEV